jgi:murein DD-endopeptidase MepM/ murein hydrolase activator NlpD
MGKGLASGVLAALCFCATIPAGANEALLADERLVAPDSDDAPLRSALPFTREIATPGIVHGALSVSTAEAGVPAAAMADALAALGTAVDLGRDLRDGDRFYVRWEQDYTIDNKPIGIGRVIWAELKTKSKGTVSVHRFEAKGLREKFWLASGKAAAPPMVRLPLDKVVISSGYGLRADPLDQPQTAPPVLSTPTDAQSAAAAAAPPIAEEDRKEIARAYSGVGSLTNPSNLGGFARPGDGFAGGRNFELDRLMAERKAKARAAERHKAEQEANAEKAAKEAEEAAANPPPPPPKPVQLFWHDGLDLVANFGTPIYAAADGVIVGARPNGLYGNWIRIDHADKWTTVYGHLQRIAPGIEPGQHVSRGELIGFVGSTGRSTGAHLHFELLTNGRSVNPANHPVLKPVELKGADLARFKKLIATELAERTREDQLAASYAPLPTTATLAGGD